MSKNAPLENEFGKRAGAGRTRIPLKDAYRCGFDPPRQGQRDVGVRNERQRVSRREILRQRKQSGAKDLATFDDVFWLVLRRRLFRGRHCVTARHRLLGRTLHCRQRAMIRDRQPGRGANRDDWETHQTMAERVHQGRD